jgi:hypothetical protein
MVTLEDYQAVLDDRPFKFTAKQVGYNKAPEGSGMTCSGCLHYYRRAIDGFSVCEIFRSDETDQEGVRPDWRCGFWTLDAQVHPLLEPEDHPGKTAEPRR